MQEASRFVSALAPPDQARVKLAGSGIGNRLCLIGRPTDLRGPLPPTTTTTHNPPTTTTTKTCRPIRQSHKLRQGTAEQTKDVQPGRRGKEASRLCRQASSPASGRR